MSQELAIVPRGVIGEAEWDALADESDEAWLWHRHRFQDALAAWPHRTDVSFAAVLSGKLVALAPGQVVRGALSRLLRVTELQTIAAPAFLPALPAGVRRRVEEAVIAEFERLASVHRAAEVTAAIPPVTPFVSGPAAPRVSPLLHLGFENATGQSWMVDLDAPAEEIRKRYSSTTRQEIRKTIAAGCEVREAGGEQDLQMYYALHRETYSRTGARALPLAYFRRIFEDFVPRGLSRVVFLTSGGEVIAAHNTAIYKRRAMYWTGASRSEKQSGATRVLMDDQIMEARRRGCRWYEVGEAFPVARKGKLKGLNDFKRSFGGELVPFFRGRIVVRPKSVALMNLIRSR